MTTTYVRTNGGAVVHLATCRYAVNGYPWEWAEGLGGAEIEQVARERGINLRWCHRCFPRGGDQ